MKINGETQYLWRAVDHEGEVLESYVTKRRNRKAALKFLRKSVKRYGEPKVIVTEKLRSYGAAMKVIVNASKQKTGRWLHNRAEKSHLPFRRREQAMLRFRHTRSSQKICRRPFVNSEPFQPRAPPILTGQFQAEPDRRSGRVVRSMCGMRDSLTVPAETGSLLSDTTIQWDARS
jgi:hypothetical protein